MSQISKEFPQSWESRTLILSVLSAIIGFIAGIIAFILYSLIGFLTNIFYYGRIEFTFVAPSTEKFGIFSIIMPVIGGLIAGLMIKYGSTKIIGHGIPEAMEAALLDKSKIKPKVGILKALSAAFTIGSGQPFGAEGPIIQTGGAFGSYIGQIFPVVGQERRILLSCGAAAGMAATFGTPIAAVFLALELLLFEFRTKSVIPIGISAAIGAWMHMILISSQPIFIMPTYNYGNIDLIPLFIVLGIICGLIGTLLTKVLYLMEDFFAHLSFNQPWRPAIGGLAVGIIGFLVPQILGVGYNVISEVLSEQVLFTMVIVILIAKAVAWVIAMGSQTSGGTLAPLFLIGASTGLIFGDLVNKLVPSLHITPGIFALAAMAAVFGSAAKAPFTSIIFAVEVTKQFQGILPIIITVLIADLIAEYLLNYSIMTEKLARRGLFAHNIYEANPWRQINILRVMNSPNAIFESTGKETEIFKIILNAQKIYSDKKPIIITENGKPIAIIELQKFLNYTASVNAELKLNEIYDTSFKTMTSNQLLYEAAKVMFLNNVNYIVVIDTNRKPIGYISQDELVKSWKQKFINEYTI